MADPAFVSQGAGGNAGANSTSVAVKTDAVQVGDLLFATVSGYTAASTSTATPKLPTGWTVPAHGSDLQSNATSGYAIFTYVAVKIATSADVATSTANISYTFGITWSASSSPGITAAIGVERGGDQTTQPDDLQVVSVTSGTAVASPVATASLSNDKLVAIYVEPGNTGGVPSVSGTGLTSEIAYGDATRGTGIQVADISLSAAGATAQYTATWQETINNAAGVFAAAFTLLVKGASSGSTNPSSGTANATPVSSGTAQQLNTSRGAAAVAVQAAGATLAILASIGTAVVPIQGAGTAQQLNGGAGTAVVAVSASGASLAVNPSSGLAVVEGSARGSSAPVNASVGATTATPGAAGASQAINPSAGTASAASTPTGAASQVNQSAGSAPATPQSAGSTVALNASAGLASPMALAAGWSQQINASICAASVALSGAGSSLPAVFPVAPGYLVRMPARSFTVSIDPRSFYAQQPARSFAVALSPRCFTAAMAGRSFYVLDDDSMPAQTFPAAMDPAEVIVCTIDGTQDLASNETLTGVAGALIVTIAGGQATDATPDQRFGTPTINQALLPANPPSQPTAIAAQKGLQVQAGASAPVDGCWYLLRQPCTTSAGRVVTLKGILQVTSR